MDICSSGILGTAQVMFFNLLKSVLPINIRFPKYSATPNIMHIAASPSSLECFFSALGCAIGHGEN